MTSSIIDVLKQMPNMLSLNGCSESEIQSAEEQLNLVFSKEYRDYTRTFGAVSIDGKQITGVVPFADASVVVSTASARSIYTDVPKDWYVVCDVHIDGLLYWQDSEGLIYKTVPGCAPQIVANSLSEYIAM